RLFAGEARIGAQPSGLDRATTVWWKARVGLCRHSEPSNNGGSERHCNFCRLDRDHAHGGTADAVHCEWSWMEDLSGSDVADALQAGLCYLRGGRLQGGL